MSLNFVVDLLSRSNSLRYTKVLLSSNPGCFFYLFLVFFFAGMIVLGSPSNRGYSSVCIVCMYVFVVILHDVRFLAVGFVGSSIGDNYVGDGSKVGGVETFTLLVEFATIFHTYLIFVCVCLLPCGGYAGDVCTHTVPVVSHMESPSVLYTYSGCKTREGGDVRVSFGECCA